MPFALASSVLKLPATSALYCKRIVLNNKQTNSQAYPHVKVKSKVVPVLNELSTNL
jgi:hypothetical protein